MNKKERIILFDTAAMNFSHILDFVIMVSVGNHLMAFFQLGAPIIERMASLLGKVKVPIIFVLASLLPVFLITNLRLMNYILVLIGTGMWFLFSSSRAIPESHPKRGIFYYSNI